VRLAHPGKAVISATRSGTFLAEDGQVEWSSVEAVLQAHPKANVLVLDASVDHSSVAALIAHENFKRDSISTLNSQERLWRAVGISSGITLIDTARIQPAATHMLEYRRQKLAQGALFGNLYCPIFLPQLFTLIGPITYAGQSAAWAHILKARLQRAGTFVLNEPHAGKAWASEFDVLRRLLDFLSAQVPANDTKPLVSGVFTLAGIAAGERLPLPPLTYTQGADQGWLSGDYLPPTPLHHPQDITNELLRSLNP
jgi:hypothetical protein